jgi:AraC family transcriptional activator of pobA
MSSIPTYALYGEFDDRHHTDWLHCERIQTRSRQHGYRIEPHRHETLFQILHLSGGDAEVTIDGQVIVLDPPCVVALPSMAVHGYRFSPDVEGQVLTFFEHRLARILEASDEIGPTFREPRVFPLVADSVLARAVALNLEMLSDEVDGRAAGRLAAIEAGLALILVALHRARPPDPMALMGRNTRSLQHAIRFRDLVDKDFRTRRAIEAYARQLGLTPTHLNRLCREYLRASALGVINRRIILEAKRYLVFTTLSAKEIAIALEFDDPSYFTRFFKRETGVSPLEFRAFQHRGAHDPALSRQPGQIKKQKSMQRADPNIALDERMV